MTDFFNDRQCLLWVCPKVKKKLANSKKQKFLFLDKTSGVMKCYFDNREEDIPFVVDLFDMKIETLVSLNKKDWYKSNTIGKIIYLGYTKIPDQKVFLKTQNIKKMYDYKFVNEPLTKRESLLLIDAINMLQKLEKNVKMY